MPLLLFAMHSRDRSFTMCAARHGMSPLQWRALLAIVSPGLKVTMIKSPVRSTIADVARHAGVSKATVSRFLNHRETLLSPEIALRVEVAIDELRYTPSPMAQALKRG